ncbi:MAG: hypothetical protein M3153_07500 [Chloroflexota bacterium]|nr:hypothetical protein [Chloroflexota bacterium]
MTISTTRPYASSIAIVSGAYAVGSATVAMMRAPAMSELPAALSIGGWVMLAVGMAVLAHGIVLLTPRVNLLERASGPLMVLWAAIMLLNQGLLAAVPGWGMTGALGDTIGSPMTFGMGWDAGMVAIAILMLASGLIMNRHRMSNGEM